MCRGLFFAIYSDKGSAMKVPSAIEQLIERLPRNERDHVQRLIEYQLTLLTLMPRDQRAHQYTKAELALTHYEVRDVASA